MNQPCACCRKIAVYWNSIMKRVQCHSCGAIPKAEAE